MYCFNLENPNPACTQTRRTEAEDSPCLQLASSEKKISQLEELAAKKQAEDLVRSATNVQAPVQV
jgi:hypothetical protein